MDNAQLDGAPLDDMLGDSNPALLAGLFFTAPNMFYVGEGGYFVWVVTE